MGVSYAAGYCVYMAPDSRVPSATAPPAPLAILPSSSDIFLHSEGTREYIFYSSDGGWMSKKEGAGVPGLIEPGDSGIALCRNPPALRACPLLIVVDNV